MYPAHRTILTAIRLPLALGLLLALTASGLLSGWVTRLTAPLAASNSAFLDRSIADTAHLMIPVGLAKAAADAIEGSTLDFEAGVVFAKAGMRIEAGDTLQPLLDYIDIAWRMLLVSMVYLVAAKSLLAGADAIAEPLLVAALAAFLLDSLAGLFRPRDHALRQAAHRVGALFLLLGLLFQLILPLTIRGSAYLAQHTTDPMRGDVRRSFDEIGTLFSLDRFHATDDFREKAVILKDKILEIGRTSQKTLGTVALAVCKLAAIKLLNGIVFPLASFAFLIWLVRGCLTPALGLSARPLSADDFRALSHWLVQPRPPTPAPSAAPRPGADPEEPAASNPTA